jgi:hypothetical protein
MTPNYQWKWDDQEDWVDVYVDPKDGSVLEYPSGYTYSHTRWVDFERCIDIETRPYFYPAEEDRAIKDRVKVASDGLSTSYYKLPEHATELRHLISHKGMSKSRGDIFKACYRLGEKDGTDTLYDLNKMKFFIEDLIEMYHRGEHL